MSDDVRRITFIYLVEVSSVDNIACQFIPRICKIWVENKLNFFSNNTYLHTLTTNVECA